MRVSLYGRILHGLFYVCHVSYGLAADGGELKQGEGATATTNAGSAHRRIARSVLINPYFANIYRRYRPPLPHKPAPPHHKPAPPHHKPAPPHHKPAPPSRYYPRQPAPQKPPVEVNIILNFSADLTVVDENGERVDVDEAAAPTTHDTLNKTNAVRETAAGEGGVASSQATANVDGVGQAEAEATGEVFGGDNTTSNVVAASVASAGCVGVCPTVVVALAEDGNLLVRLNGKTIYAGGLYGSGDGGH